MSYLTVKNVNKRFGGLKALNEVNLEVEQGTVHAIIGPNGAGKSTLLNCFVGRLEPDTGTVDFGGVSLLGLKPHQINQVGVSRVFQTPEIFGDLSLIENVMIPAFARRDGAFRLNGWASVSNERDLRTQAMDKLSDVGLAPRANHIAGTLSRGDKRRLELAMCLVQEPKLLLLDEPVAGMSDEETERTGELFLSLAGKHSLVVVEHDMAFIEKIARKVTVLHEGSVLAEGPMQQVQNDPKVIEVYLGR
jgi:branched-chain amino acid transport system ATP-binding protein